MELIYQKVVRPQSFKEKWRHRHEHVKIQFKMELWLEAEMEEVVWKDSSMFLTNNYSAYWAEEVTEDQLITQMYQRINERPITSIWVSKHFS